MATSEHVVVSKISGQVVATGVSFDEYMDKYAADFCEWVRGTVITLKPITGQHDRLTFYLRTLIDTYLELRPVGRAISWPFVMRLEKTESAREPDIQVILHTNPGDFTEIAMIGPADLCVEVVSPGSVERDYTEKFEEYEQGGVREYWIINPLRNLALFYRLDEMGNYLRYPQDEDGNYRTPTLPDLVLHVPTLWQKELPGPIAVGKAVQAMLEQAI